MPTLNSIRNTLGQPMPLGYCNVGIVQEVGEGVLEFNIADKPVSLSALCPVFFVIPKEVSLAFLKLCFF